MLECEQHLSANKMADLALVFFFYSYNNVFVAILFNAVNVKVRLDLIDTLLSVVFYICYLRIFGGASYCIITSEED